MIITIDGPAGAGKSTVSKGVANELDLLALDTGSFYRAVTYAALKYGCAEIEDRVLTLVSPKIIGWEDGAAVTMFGEDVSTEIRGPEVTRAVSMVAAYPRVRQAMVPIFRQLAQASNLIAEGRDAGTVIFPDAELKVFLDASASLRALRRVKQNGGSIEDVAAIAAQDYLETVRRDYDDCTREADPLRVPSDSVVIASDNLSLRQVIRVIVGLAHTPPAHRPRIITEVDIHS